MMLKRTKKPLAALLVSGLSLSVWADDLDALNLADQAEVAVVKQRDWQLFIEGMYGNVKLDNDQGNIPIDRLSIDLQIDTAIQPELRFFLANRLDVNGQEHRHETVNTLKEGYISWQMNPQSAFDLGRVNQRNGVAMGYNPTDYFKVGALRSVVSIAPSSLRENRLGAGMLRGQYLWDGGAVSGIFAPKLGDQRDDATFALDFGASNPVNRWQVSATQKISEGIAPQLIVFGEEGQSPQVGLNLSLLASDALSVYAEYSGGRSVSLLNQSLQKDSPSRFYSRLATGATYTFASNISLNLEYQFNEAAPDKDTWHALWRQPQAYWAYRSYVFNAQDMPTQHAAFAYITWNDALVRDLDINWMLRQDLVDHSQQSWLEARYHFKHADLALQWQYQRGNAGSVYGALPQRQSIQALLKYFF